MSRKVDELESKISKLLPKNSASKVDPAIPDLTRALIKEGENTWETLGYTHSVCHLFEGYGGGNCASYLNSSSLLPVAEELVNYTLKKAIEDREFGCVGRIIRPIMALNLSQLEENPEGFMFKPKILTDPKFIQELSLSREVEDEPHLVDFCKSSSIGEFFPKYVEALRKIEKLESITNADEVVPGVFIDVDNTLIEYDHYDGDKKIVIYNKLPFTQEYALKKIQEGVPVTVFTGGDLESAIEGLKSTGIDERLCDVKSKKEFIGRILEICIDNTALAMQGFKAKTHYASGKEAWDAEYSEDK